MQDDPIPNLGDVPKVMFSCSFTSNVFPTSPGLPERPPIKHFSLSYAQKALLFVYLTLKVSVSVGKSRLDEI